MNYVYQYLCLISSLILITCSPKNEEGIVISDDTFVYEKNNFSSKHLSKLNLFDKIEIVPSEKDDMFYKVRYKGINAWILRDCLKNISKNNEFLDDLKKINFVYTNNSGTFLINDLNSKHVKIADKCDLLFCDSKRNVILFFRGKEDQKFRFLKYNLLSKSLSELPIKSIVLSDNFCDMKFSRSGKYFFVGEVMHMGSSYRVFDNNNNLVYEFSARKADWIGDDYLVALIPNWEFSNNNGDYADTSPFSDISLINIHDLSLKKIITADKDSDYSYFFFKNKLYVDNIISNELYDVDLKNLVLKRNEDVEVHSMVVKESDIIFKYAIQSPLNGYRNFLLYSDNMLYYKLARYSGESESSFSFFLADIKENLLIPVVKNADLCLMF